MKNILVFLISSILLPGCQNKNSDHERFISILQKEMRFPKVIEFDVFCSDPAYVKKILSTDLENGGWVIIHRNQKLNDVGDPLISFTDKSEPYLSPKSEMERAIGIQKVKIAEEDLDKIINIHHDIESNSIEIEYTTVYKNITPFPMLTAMQSKEKQTRKAHFKFSDSTWQLMKKK